MTPLTKITSSKKIWIKKSELKGPRDDIDCGVTHVTLYGKSVCVPH